MEAVDAVMLTSGNVCLPELVSFYFASEEKVEKGLSDAVLKYFRWG